MAYAANWECSADPLEELDPDYGRVVDDGRLGVAIRDIDDAAGQFVSSRYRSDCRGQYYIEHFACR